MSDIGTATPATDASTSAVDDVAQPGQTTVRTWLRTNRGPIAVVVVLVLAALLVAAAQSQRFAGAFDPDAVDPSGSHALAVLLADQGVTVVRVTDASSAAEELDRAGGDATLLIVPTAPLSTQMIDAVADAPRTRTVLVEPDPETLDAFASWASEVEPLEDPTVEVPADCTWWVGQKVGDLPSEGMTYQATGNGTHSCWKGLVVDDSGAGDTATTVIGASQALTNKRLADSGYAALDLTTLGHSRTLVWWVPSITDPLQFGDGEQPPTISDLIPSWVGWMLLQLAVVVGVVIWWRGRRLGRVVVEPLPVVVRATETVEGRARLYRRGRARGRAADALRTATTERLRRLLALPRGASLNTVVSATSARTGRSIGDVAALLGPGAEPTDDASLTGLADALDTLENEVRRP